MFTIEIVIIRGNGPPHVVNRASCGDRRLPEAETTARSRLEELQKESAPLAAPDGYQIFDENNRLVLRSWERGDA